MFAPPSQLRRIALLPHLLSGKPRHGSVKRAVRLHLEMKSEHAGMLREHREILKGLSRLKKIGAQEGYLTAVRFAEALELYVKEEEEILYPAALLAGRLASRSTKAD